MKRMCLAIASVTVALLTPTVGGARIPESAASQPLSLSSRVVQPETLPGAWVVRRPWAFVGRGAGTVAGLREQLSSALGRVVSVVVECTSGLAARDRLRTWYRHTQSEPASALAAGAVGSSGATRTTVSFVDGRFAYLVAVSWTPGTRRPLTRVQLLAAATALYERVHGHPAG